jgi:hypothetical protein
MRWNTLMALLYNSLPSSSRPDRNRRPDGRVQASRTKKEGANEGERSMPNASELAMQLDEYRRYVSKMAKLANGDEVILNQSHEHAAIIIAEIFAKARKIVEIVTDRLPNEPFGTSDVVQASSAFLSRDPTAEINILSEEEIDQGQNRLLNALKIQGLADRVHLYFVPESAKSCYTFHSVVGDALHYRLQKSRDDFSAIVQFGNVEYGQKLHNHSIKLKTLSQPVAIE